MVESASYMNSRVRILLNTAPEQAARLAALQAAFAEACNALAPLAAQHRCWNRVALHHLAYRQMRERFPDLGSQMVCNAIYSVSRTSRTVYQHPASPFHLSRWGQRPLPVLRFLSTAPVYFDRHTLSLKAGQVSLFTLDGRMRFELGLAAADEQRFRDGKLREIVLSRQGETFVLTFSFTDLGQDAAAAVAAAADAAESAESEWPEYVLVQEQASEPPLASHGVDMSAPRLSAPSPSLTQVLR